MSGRLLLLRHGESTWNAEGRWQGLHDPPLSATGENQAREAALLLADLDIQSIVTSDLQRARRTAELIAEGLGIAQPTSDERLRERDAGSFGGLTWTEIEDRFPEFKAARERGERIEVPGANNEGFDERAVETIKGLVDQLDGLGIAVTHGGFIRAVAHTIGAGVIRAHNLGGAWIVDKGGKLEIDGLFPHPRDERTDATIDVISDQPVDLSDIV